LYDGLNNYIGAVHAPKIAEEHPTFQVGEKTCTHEGQMRKEELLAFAVEL
jgi:hypothetical protein